MSTWVATGPLGKSPRYRRSHWKAPLSRLWQECMDLGDPRAQLSWVLSIIDLEDVPQSMHVVKEQCKRGPGPFLPDSLIKSCWV